MATAYHNLSDYDFSSGPSAEKMKFGIVVSEWNYNITGALLKGRCVEETDTPCEGDVKAYEKKAWEKAQILPSVEENCMSKQFSHILSLIHI